MAVAVALAWELPDATGKALKRFKKEKKEKLKKNLGRKWRKSLLHEASLRLNGGLTVFLCGVLSGAMRV